MPVRAAPTDAVTAIAPGKLILSGEHAVLHGAPILLSAINKVVRTQVSRQAYADVLFHMPDLSRIRRFSWSALRALKRRLQRQHAAFLADQQESPSFFLQADHLLPYVIAFIREHWSLAPLGLAIHTQSELPVGSGMGSSSAVIVSSLRAAVHALDLPWIPEEMLSLGQYLEHMQHGYSSGADIRTALLGGAWWGKHGSWEAVHLPADLVCSVVFTGRSEVSTGVCVRHTRRVLAHDRSLLDAFSVCTHTIAQLLRSPLLCTDADGYRLLGEAIAENHRLLSFSGVVPVAVQSAIHELECEGWFAKICGAGATAGGAAGPVWVWHPPSQIEAVAAWAHTRNWPFWRVCPLADGVTLA